MSDDTRLAAAWASYDRAVAESAISRAYALAYPSPAADRGFLTAKSRETSAAYRVMVTEAWIRHGAPSFLVAPSPREETP